MVEDFIVEHVKIFEGIVGIKPKRKEIIQIGYNETFLLVFNKEHSKTVMEKYLNYMGNKLFAIKFE